MLHHFSNHTHNQINCTNRIALANMSSPNFDQSEYQKGVKHLCDNGITRIPDKYVLPVSDRPSSESDEVNNLRLPVIDFAELLGPNRSRVLNSLAKACEEYGFFQLRNHNVSIKVVSDMIDASKRFFELPFEERSKYMSGDMKSLVRYGTSFNQNKDGVFCWRDFLKLSCHPLHDVLPFWPSSPMDLRGVMVNYAEEMKMMYVKLVEAILESLGLLNKMGVENESLKEIEEGGQLMVVNWYPTCPEPELTLGMPPHSDYGFLTILLQHQVKGLEIQHLEEWVMVDPLPNSFVINVGDHLEILSNGRYKSVVHRAVVNGSEPRISVASLHSLPSTSVVRPWPELVDDETNPRRYMDTHCRAFFDYISSCEPKSKSFLDSRKLL